MSVFTISDTRTMRGRRGMPMVAVCFIMFSTPIVTLFVACARRNKGFEY